MAIVMRRVVVVLMKDDDDSDAETAMAKWRVMVLLRNIAMLM